MKVALSTKNNMITNHFGRCDYFIVYEIENQKIKASSLIKNPPHHEGLLPKYLSDKGIEVVITGGIGKNAIDYLKKFNIKCYMNVQGEASDVIKMYMNGSLKNHGEPCNHDH